MKVGIWGICGKMGKMLYETIKETDKFQTIFGVDQSIKKTIKKDIYLYGENSKINDNVDVIIDFSNHDSTTNLLALSKKLYSPLLICSTGQTCKDLNEIRYASLRIPIMITPNTSLGSAFLINTAINGAKCLDKDFEIDISETHSIHKKDMPSGTAIAILQAILSVRPNLVPIYTFTDYQKRIKDQIVVTSKRIDDKVGDHEICFKGNDESIIIKHQVFNRKVFALGALECAKFLVGKPAGLYKMEDMILEKYKRNCRKNSNLEPQK
ncbi:MAG: 4-hydroxy-tetrahydrodipicolinate reductase [Clostridia bacterium]|nr:4-hydroxy-tetrahydrodipicolinate reductase [Clostridia bacterium]